MEEIIVFGIFGMLVSLISPACVSAHECRKEDTRLFGIIPIALIGIFGYLLIALTAALYSTYNIGFMLLANQMLIGFAGLFTIYLVRKAVRIHLGCPMCFLIWIINAILLSLAVISYFANTQTASPLV